MKSAKKAKFPDPKEEIVHRAKVLPFLPPVAKAAPLDMPKGPAKQKVAVFDAFLLEYLESHLKHMNDCMLLINQTIERYSS